MLATNQLEWAILDPMHINSIDRIHPALRWFPNPKPKQIVIKVTANDQAIPLTDLAINVNNDVFTGKLNDLSSGESYDLKFSAPNDNGRFIADWPKNAFHKGEYGLEVTLVTDNISPLWIPLTTSSPQLSILMQDNIVSMPWSLLALLILVAIAIGSYSLLWLGSGSLYKCWLRFKSVGDASGDVCQGDVRVYSFFRRRRYIVTPEICVRDLPGCFMEKIEVRSVIPQDDKNARVAADISLYLKGNDKEPGEVTQINSLNEGQPILINPVTEMVLEKQTGIPKGPLLWFSQVWYFLFFSLFVLVIWFGVFANLYLNA
jgi:hypothetical protein